MAATSVLPFVAILQGRNRVAADRRTLTALLVATAVFVALVLLHQRLFGVAVL